MTVVRPFDPLADASSDDGGPDDGEVLDAYSRVVTGVVERLTPTVASLRVWKHTRGGRSEGSGSAVAITPDGYLVTSAHVIQGSDRGEATFADGREVPVDVVGTDGLSDLAAGGTARGAARGARGGAPPAPAAARPRDRPRARRGGRPGRGRQPRRARRHADRGPDPGDRRLARRRHGRPPAADGRALDRPHA